MPIFMWFLGHSDISATLVRKHICNIDVTYLQRDRFATSTKKCVCVIYTTCHLSNVTEIHDSVNMSQCHIDKQIHDSFYFL